MKHSIQNLLNRFADLPEFVGVPLENIDVRGYFGNTLLHIAAVRNDIDAVRVLIEGGANVNSEGEHGYTPLHEAVEQGHFEIADLLIKSGADTHKENKDRETPRDIARLLPVKDLRIIALFNSTTGG